ncbi:MAG: DUF805 domain-containing protein [Phycisphaeraceae bacterium]
MKSRALLSVAVLLAIPLCAFADGASSTREFLFLDGHRSTFSTKGHPKAKGANFTIAYPSSWAAEEGVRPNIVQKFTSEGGRGLETMMVTTKDVPPDMALTEEVKRAVLSPEQLPEMLPKGAVLIEARSTEIEGEPAGIVEFTLRAERGELSLATHMRILSFFVGNTLVQVQFGVAGPAGAEDYVTGQMDAHRPLFALMANSIVFPDKWIAPTPAAPSGATVPAGPWLSPESRTILVVIFGCALTSGIVVFFLVRWLTRHAVAQQLADEGSATGADCDGHILRAGVGAELAEEVLALMGVPASDSPLAPPSPVLNEAQERMTVKGDAMSVQPRKLNRDPVKPAADEEVANNKGPLPAEELVPGELDDDDPPAQDAAPYLLLAPPKSGDSEQLAVQSATDDQCFKNDQPRYRGIGRIEYFVGMLGLTLLSYGFGIATHNQADPNVGLLASAVVGALSLVHVIYRLHNIGMSGWRSLWLFVPIANLVVGVQCLTLPEGYQDTRKLDVVAHTILLISIGIAIGSIALVCIVVFSPWP